ncbi:hypothetical protein [Paenibacillus abyssi]|uniref:Uncharacterized protein n=1 Tax=Paenibacillus abyssi TaxID=1340531 RepID=A0A917CQC0_9BACL|nr:hypothetical protein [Paenibacillus abyssi]GGF95988.1 hypothetical protein GCM10010916_11600 [Paenibacillus abyssi]
MSTPSTVINIFILKINSFENASAVNIGQNFLAEWSNSDKRNQGYGQNSGDGVDFMEPRCFVDDKDGVDSPSFFHPVMPAPLVNNE